MKIVLTGSLGNISKPLAQELAQTGNHVTVISSNPEKQAAIEALGATAAIGSVENVDFLANTFRGADVVYCMVPPGNYLDPNFAMREHYNKVGQNYAQAILRSGVKKVIHLSSIGGNMEENNGMLVFHHDVETIFKSLPEEIIVKTIRPVSFFTNLFAFIPAIKNRGVIVSNYGGEDRCAWVSPVDIASAVAEEITSEFIRRTFRYVASEELSCNEIASALGAAIGKPDLKWLSVSDEDALTGLLSAGLNTERANGLVEMNANIHNGKLFEDYNKHKPVVGKVTLADFAPTFAKVFNS